MKLYLHKTILRILLKVYPKLFTRYLAEYAEVFNGYVKKLLKEKQNDRCEICGIDVYFDKSPEYDVCSRCDKHICIKCGTLDLVNGGSMCKEHIGETK